MFDSGSWRTVSPLETTISVSDVIVSVTEAQTPPTVAVLVSTETLVMCSAVESAV
jgi:hypothetical protein